MKIYTKTGDSGTTGLFAGPRVPKDHPRIAAYGTVDELNALLGVVAAALPATKPEADEPEADEPEADEPEADEPGADEPGATTTQHEPWLLPWILEVQSDLFAVGAELATPDPQAHGMCLLQAERSAALERMIDELEAQLPPLSNFVLPGGSHASALLHLARTVCRRAERDVVHLNHQAGVQDCGHIVIYLNRLSDLLFVCARWANQQAGIADRPWVRPQI